MAMLSLGPGDRSDQQAEVLKKADNCRDDDHGAVVGVTTNFGAWCTPCAENVVINSDDDGVRTQLRANRHFHPCVFD